MAINKLFSKRENNGNFIDKTNDVPDWEAIEAEGGKHTGDDHQQMQDAIITKVNEIIDDVNSPDRTISAGEGLTLSAGALIDHLSIDAVYIDDEIRKVIAEDSITNANGDLVPLNNITIPGTDDFAELVTTAVIKDIIADEIQALPKELLGTLEFDDIISLEDLITQFNDGSASITIVDEDLNDVTYNLGDLTTGQYINAIPSDAALSTVLPEILTSFDDTGKLFFTTNNNNESIVIEALRSKVTDLENNKLDTSVADDSFVRIDGSVPMGTGYVPIDDKAVATKEYVDAEIANSGHITAGDLIADRYISPATPGMGTSYAPINSDHVSTKDYVDQTKNMLIDFDALQDQVIGENQSRIESAEQDIIYEGYRIDAALLQIAAGDSREADFVNKNTGLMADGYTPTTEKSVALKESVDGAIGYAQAVDAKVILTNAEVAGLEDRTNVLENLLNGAGFETQLGEATLSWVADGGPDKPDPQAPISSSNTTADFQLPAVANTQSNGEAFDYSDYQTIDVILYDLTTVSGQKVVVGSELGQNFYFDNKDFDVSCKLDNTGLLSCVRIAGNDNLGNNLRLVFIEEEKLVSVTSLATKDYVDVKVAGIDLSTKQDVTDVGLNTANKTITGSINEVYSLANANDASIIANKDSITDNENNIVLNKQSVTDMEYKIFTEGTSTNKKLGAGTNGMEFEYTTVPRIKLSDGAGRSVTHSGWDSASGQPKVTVNDNAGTSFDFVYKDEKERSNELENKLSSLETIIDATDLTTYEAIWQGYGTRFEAGDTIRVITGKTGTYEAKTFVVRVDPKLANQSFALSGTFFDDVTKKTMHLYLDFPSNSPDVTLTFDAWDESPTDGATEEYVDEADKDLQNQIDDLSGNIIRTWFYNNRTSSTTTSYFNVQVAGYVPIRILYVDAIKKYRNESRQPMHVQKVSDSMLTTLSASGTELHRVWIYNTTDLAFKNETQSLNPCGKGAFVLVEYEKS